MAHAFRVNDDGNLVASPVISPLRFLRDTGDQHCPAHALYAERSAICAKYRALRNEIEAKERLLPWWVQPGPEFVDEFGTFTGETSWNTASPDFEKPSAPGTLRLIRLSPKWIDAVVEKTRMSLGDDAAERHRAELQARMDRNSDLAKAVRADAGLHALEATEGQLEDRLNENRERIEALDPASSAGAMAARTIVELLCSSTDDDTIDGGTALTVARIVLSACLPHLHGELERDVREAVSDRHLEIGKMRIWL